MPEQVILQFEDIVPWENNSGDTGLSARLKLKRNFEKIKAWFDYQSQASGLYLRKDIADSAHEVITFEKGLEAGQFTQDLQGAAMWEDADHNWHIEGDYLHARKKLVAKELQIEEVTHVGGQQLSTAASMLCAFVIDKSTFWRCFFVKKGDDGRVVTNKWKAGDQAFCRTFNIDQQADQTQGDHFFWRLVVASSADSSTTDSGADGSGSYTIDGITYDVDDYHFIDLSKTVCASDSDAPLPGDNIVQLGYQPNDDSSRQNAIIIAGAGSGSPYIYILTGIHSFTLPEPEIQLKPGDNRFTGTVKMTAGSMFGNNTLQSLLDALDASALSAYQAALAAQTAADAASTAATNAQGTADDAIAGLGNLSTGNENLVVNGGFTGVYESESVESNLTVNSGTGIFSDPWGYWSTHDGCTDISTLASATGKACRMANGTLVQTILRGIKQGKDYTFSLLATSSGNVSVSIGGVQRSLALVSGQRASVTITTASTSSVLTITGSGDITEIVLIQGNIPVSDWIPSPIDNNKYLSYYKNLAYLLEALERGSTSVLGGLILTNQIRVGNSENGQFVLETGGMNGLNPYADDSAPFLWGGGNMDKAIYTIGRYADNPNYTPTQNELANLMAKFVVTHGGRAILNDVILRGYIYALGGVFNGTIRATAGEFKGSSGMFGFKVSADERAIIITGPSKVTTNSQNPTSIADFVPAQDATEVEYMRIGAWGVRPVRSAEGFRIVPRIAGRSLKIDGTTSLQFALDSINGLGFADGDGNELARYSGYKIGGPNVDTLELGNLPTSENMVSQGQVWNDNGTLKIKQ